jgi:hypothetical protein
MSEALKVRHLLEILREIEAEHPQWLDCEVRIHIPARGMIFDLNVAHCDVAAPVLGGDEIGDDCFIIRSPEIAEMPQPTAPFNA